MSLDETPARLALGTDTPEGRLMRQATYASVGVAGSLILIKLLAWALTDSVALLSSLVDSTLDAMASLVTLMAVRQALVPADHDHRFGHGKAEPLAGLAQAAFITGSGLFLVAEAVQRLGRPAPVDNGPLGIAVMVISIALTLGLVAFQRHVVKKTASVAITADSVHYTGDILLNGAVIVSLLLSAYGGITVADPLFALAIAAYLIHNAWGIGREALDLLMDRELPEEERQRILEVVRAHPEVIDAHDLRTRSSGLNTFIQVHVEMPRDLSLLAAHDIAHQVQRDLERAFPNADVIIHQDPAGLVEPHHVDHAYDHRQGGHPERNAGFE
ncbi:cation diffusion facilitator family transporter [Roseospirillum parvum]|uniref:Cation-efflux pump FieF n=1 Tax=Roseospirillum parvum TaxID=83401 RepID=A0A1G8DK83_9PROT|nr:cation diffusion facilitator family transporter [Roseospirillum parvum]SDH58103.1 ferrous-iron efflux pump FieF [Roseospirillum parvum]